jgi:hypothetical protein
VQEADRDIQPHCRKSAGYFEKVEDSHVIYIFGECTLDMQRHILRHAGRISRLRRKAF